MPDGDSTHGRTNVARRGRLRDWDAFTWLLVLGMVLLTCAVLIGPYWIGGYHGRPVKPHRRNQSPSPAAADVSVQRQVVPDVSVPPAPRLAPGIVWVNTRSGIYHFPGYRWYGGTIHGKYTREQDALAEGDRAARNERRPANFDSRPLQ